MAFFYVVSQKKGKKGQKWVGKFTLGPSLGSHIWKAIPVNSNFTILTWPGGFLRGICQKTRLIHEKRSNYMALSITIPSGKNGMFFLKFSFFGQLRPKNGPKSPLKRDFRWSIPFPQWISFKMRPKLPSSNNRNEKKKWKKFRKM